MDYSAAKLDPEHHVLRSNSPLHRLEYLVFVRLDHANVGLRTPVKTLTRPRGYIGGSPGQGVYPAEFAILLNSVSALDYSRDPKPRSGSIPAH